MDVLTKFIQSNFNVAISDIQIPDIIEIAIIAVLLYEVMLWIKNTRAWVLLRGMVVLLGFIVIAAIFEMNTILWIADKTINVGILAVVIIFQPELRKALEQLGQSNVISGLLNTNNTKNSSEAFSVKTINEIVRASAEMSKAKTGALIVIERNISMSEYIRTGITVDGVVTSQLLLNIFEHNTPLHDGAVIVRGNRIISATCYLPLSDNMKISKDLGTRHRAGLGISEVADCVTVIVSEETGGISLTYEGNLFRGLTGEELKTKLLELTGERETTGIKRLKLLKGWQKHERNSDK